jgi:hypothetical protein
VLPALPVSARRHCCLASSSSFRTQPLPTGLDATRSRLSAARAVSTTPRALPCRATVPPPTLDGRGPLPTALRCRPLCRAPLCSFSCPHAAPSQPPPPFTLAAPRTERFQKLPTSLPFFSISFSIRSACRYLPTPPPSPVTSPPRHRETEPLLASTFRPLGESGPPCVMSRNWHAPHLLPSPLVLQDPATSAARDQSASATMGHRHVASTPPSHVEPLLG